MSVSGDCDDTNKAVHPKATESIGNGNVDETTNVLTYNKAGAPVMKTAGHLTLSPAPNPATQYVTLRINSSRSQLIQLRRYLLC